MLLSKIQTELKAPKGQYNNFGKYKYRSLEDILEGVKHILKKYECAIILSDTIEMVGSRFYVKATAKLVDKDEHILAENTAYAREVETKKGMDLAQITGATSSYARKYALNGLLAIDDTKDADTQDNREQTDTKIDTKTAKDIAGKIEILGIDVEQFLHYFKVKKIEELSITQAKKAQATLNKRMEKDA